MNIQNDKYKLNFSNVGYNCITGTNFQYINEVICGVDNFFGGKKDVGVPFSILDGNIKLNKKDYLYIKISPLMHSIDEVEISKTSYIKKIISDITDSLDEEFKIYENLSNLIADKFQDKKIFDYSKLDGVSEGLDDIHLQFSVAEINKKLFLDSILNMNFIKNGKENEVLTSYEISIIVLNILKMVLSMNSDKKILILIDNIEYKMNDIEKQKILNKILTLCDDRTLILHFTDSLILKNIKYQIERTIILNDEVISEVLDDKIIRDMQDSYPGHLEYEEFMEKYIVIIATYYKYLSKEHYLLIKDSITKEDNKMLYAINDVFLLDMDIEP